MRFRRRVVKWGRGFGIRLSQDDLNRLGAQVGDEVVVAIRAAGDPVDLSHLKTYHWGGELARRHDEAFEEEAGEECRRTQRRR